MFILVCKCIVRQVAQFSNFKNAYVYMRAWIHVCVHVQAEVHDCICLLCPLLLQVSCTHICEYVWWKLGPCFPSPLLVTFHAFLYTYLCVCAAGVQNQVFIFFPLVCCSSFLVMCANHMHTCIHLHGSQDFVRGLKRVPRVEQEIDLQALMAELSDAGTPPNLVCCLSVYVRIRVLSRWRLSRY